MTINAPGVPLTSRICVAACLIAASTSVQAQSLPSFSEEKLKPFEVTYSVGNNLINAGTASLVLKRNNNQWDYSLKTQPTGVFKLTGKGKIQEFSSISVVSEQGAARFQPLSYRYRQDNESRRSIDALFNWGSNQLTFSKRGKEVTQDITEPLLDRLSVTLAVMNGLREGFEKANAVVFDNGSIKNMEFVNEGNYTVKTRMGNIDTIRVRSRNAAGGSRETLTWFAPKFDFVPVKIEQHKRGDLVARLSLTRLRNHVTDLDYSEDTTEN